MKADKFSRDMTLLSEVIGDENVRKVMCRLGGLYLYVPKPTHNDIIEELKDSGFDVKGTAYKLGVSQRKVERVLKEWREEQFFEQRQMKMNFD